MKTFKLDNEPKIKPGFIVPENYFENFSAKMMKQIPVEEPKVISILQRRKKWIYAAAAIFIFALSIPIYNNYFLRSTEIEDLTLENYITYQSNLSSVDLTNLLDREDIKSISIDLNIDDKSIENELILNKNLEQYLLN